MQMHRGGRTAAPNSLDTEKSPEPDGSGDFASLGEELG